jgi:large conductance mechanosensitive channel
LYWSSQAALPLAGVWDWAIERSSGKGRRGGPQSAGEPDQLCENLPGLQIPDGHYSRPAPNIWRNTMGMLQEFKEFAVKGNVIDLAVGVIIGGAFGKIVTSMVDDVIMPIVGAIFGSLDFTNLFIALGRVPEGTAPTLAALKAAGVPTLAYGNFITVALNFTIMAFIIFIMVKQINRLKRETPAAPPEPAATPEDIALLREIRDSLRK